MTICIRDYLYLDIDRVRSIYAQASGGLIESIRQLQENVRVNSEKDAKSGEELGENILLGRGRVATQVLHDYLFSSVEEKLGRQIVEVTAKSVSQIQPGTLFRISGRAEIDHVERMLNIMENYNDMYKYLLAIAHSSEIQERVWDLEDLLHNDDKAQQVRNSRNAKNQRKDIENELKNLEPEAISSAILRDQRAGISPIISETFKRIYGLFYRDIFEIKIVAPFDDSTIFRGIINTEHLREDPTRIYAKYGSRPNVNWTMVGQVTTIKIPSKSNNVEEDMLLDTGEVEDVVDDDRDPDLRDSFENLYATISDLEEIIIGPGARSTWIATPLAIFHEVN